MSHITSGGLLAPINARLTKRTGDRILLTRQTVESLDQRADGLIDRGPYELKGKADAVTIYALEPTLTQAH